MIALAISLISQLPQHLFSVEVAAFCPFSGISFPKVYENHTEKVYDFHTICIGGRKKPLLFLHETLILHCQ